MTNHMMRCVGAAFVLLIGAVIPAGATEFHVSPSALPNGNGSRSNPWMINVALQSSTVQPGDTITLDGGMYVNPTNGQDQIAFKCTISGSSSRPIIVRAAPGQHVKLDGANSQQNDILFVSGSYVWFRGLEIYSSSTARYSATGGSFPPASEIHRGTCVGITQEHTISGDQDHQLHPPRWVPGILQYFSRHRRARNCTAVCSTTTDGWLRTETTVITFTSRTSPGTPGRRTQTSSGGRLTTTVQAYGTHNTDDFSFDSNVIFQTGSDDGAFLIGGADRGKQRGHHEQLLLSEQHTPGSSISAGIRTARG